MQDTQTLSNFFAEDERARTRFLQLPELLKGAYMVWFEDSEGEEIVKTLLTLNHWENVAPSDVCDFADVPQGSTWGDVRESLHAL